MAKNSAKLKQNKRERGKKKDKQMGKIVCKTCQKVWPDREDYMKDNVKCGKDTCPNLSASKEMRENAIKKVEYLFRKGKPVQEAEPKAPTIHVEVSYDKIKSKTDPLKERHMVYDVPKVIYAQIKRK